MTVRFPMMALHYYSREENLELFHRVCRSIKGRVLSVERQIRADADV